MPRAKICRCGKLIPYDLEMCTKCAVKVRRERKEATQHYDKFNRKNATIYADKRWKRLTKECKNNTNAIDIYQMYKYGKIRKGNLSHHIIEIEDDEDRIFDITNLIWLTNASHTEIHLEYLKSAEEKKRLQSVLFEYLKRFESEFGM